MNIRKLNLLVDSYLKLRYKTTKTEEELGILKNVENQELWDFVSLVDSSVAQESFLISQKFFITGALVYMEAKEVFEHLLFLLELLEKRIRVPSFLTVDYLLILVDLRTTVLYLFVLLSLTIVNVESDCDTNDGR